MSNERRSPERPNGPAEVAQDRGLAHVRLGATVEDHLGPVTEHGVGGGVAVGLRQFRERAHAEATTSPHGRWRSIGPSVVENGQVEAKGAREVSGRVDGIAYAPNSKKIYIATCNAGVWCRDASPSGNWICLMDARPRRHKFDEDPEYLGSDSLACGAIAVAPTDEKRIYVGSGEPFGAVDSYHGVGPIVSKNAGDSWTVEEVTSDSTPLKGRGFFALAVDPKDRGRVVAATRAGIYVRQQGGLWKQVKGDHEGHAVTSVVAVCPTNGQTTFFDAREGGQVYESSDGEAWNEVGKGSFPSGAGRVELAVRPADPNLIYALVAKESHDPPEESDASVHSVLRIQKVENAWTTWQPISKVPPKLFGDPEEGSCQGWYDLAIAVDPDDENRVYLGGSGFFSGNKHQTSLYRCDIQQESLAMTPTRIGRSVHSDIHALVFAGKELWVGCDGGVFHARKPCDTASQLFEPCNRGLSTMTMEGLGQHPTEPGQLYGGTQDNGGLYYDGNPERIWTMVAKGDAPCVVVNWAKPNKVLFSKPHMPIRRSATGSRKEKTEFDLKDNLVVPGETFDDNGKRVGGEPEANALFYAPLVGTPYNPGCVEQADRVATGSHRVWLSDDFGKTFTSLPTGCGNGERLEHPSDKDNTRISSLTFVDYDTLYVGTMVGRVYRYDYGSASDPWRAPDRLDFGSSPRSPVTCIAADPATKNGIYVTYGGPPGIDSGPGQTTTGCDYRRVWHYDPNRPYDYNTGSHTWEARSGDPKKSSHLLNVHHSAIAVDPHPQDKDGRPTTEADGKHWLYAGADIGVWRSKDEGMSWEPCARGLPDAAVVDLKFHPSIGPNGQSVSDVKPVRLRASTHGRGVFEYCPVPSIKTIASRFLFESIRGMALDPKGENLYLTNDVPPTRSSPPFSEVLKLRVAGNKTEIGKPTPVAGQAGGIQGLLWPMALACDSQGNLYVADCEDHCVRKIAFGQASPTMTIVAGRQGTPGPYDPCDDGKPATQVTMQRIQGLAWDEHNKFLYVSSSSGSSSSVVQRIDFNPVTPTITRIAGSKERAGSTAYQQYYDGPATKGSLFCALSMTVAHSGKAVFIADDYSVHKVAFPAESWTGATMTTLAGTDGGFPNAMRVLQLDEELGYVFFCDDQERRIRAIDISTPPGDFTTIAATTASGPETSGGDARAKSTQPLVTLLEQALHPTDTSPTSVAWDKQRNILYVACQARIFKVEGL